MAAKLIPVSQARLRELLRYDPATGVFIWLINKSNRVEFGTVAGSIVEDRGYRSIRIDGRPYRAHRLAWLWMTGEWPSHGIDHINGIPGDDRWANLRAATQSQNLANMRKSSRNTSGFKGVFWHSGARKWRARLKSIHLGYFDCPAAAHEAYMRAAREHFGEFARSA
jgi:hypothetical protein